jgi:hypothetical protein
MQRKVTKMTKVATVQHRMQLYQLEASVLPTDCFCKAYSATSFCFYKCLQRP